MAGKTQYLRQVDFDQVNAVPDSERVSKRLIDRDSGATACMISYIRTPPQGGSPRGLHVHEVDQHFYVLSGVMNIEVDGERFEAGPGSLVYFPAGVPHMNWNEKSEPTVHLAINAPLPPVGEALENPVG
jgi:mannose-6-phosphate isomerase-like protein (cupin superfamily)